MPTALDAPTASLPLINSLTHLSYLTATSPRVREILAGDGGLERLVSILQQCAQGGAAAASAAGASASSSRLSGSLDRKGKGKAIDRPRPRRSPFKPFAEYSALPSMADIQVFEELGLPIGSTAPTTSFVDQPMPFALPPSLALPLPNKQRFLLHTYTLAFQCIVNIGVRGSEAIRTRVVEAGALDVVVYVLERYLEDVERRRLEASAEWRRQREITAAGAAFLAGEDAVMQVENDPLVPTFAVSSAAAGTTPTLALPPSTASLPLLTRVNVVAASSSSSSISPGLQPPSRVQTPDTVLSMDDSSVTGDENGSASGPDAEGDEVSMPSSSGSSSASTVAAPVPRSAIAERKVALADVDAGSDVEMRDQSRPESPAPGSSAQSTRRHARQALPRVRTAQTGLTASTLDSRAEFAASSAGSSPVSYDPAATAGTARDASNASGPLRFRDEDVLLSLQLLAYLSKYPHVRAIFHSSAVASLPLPPAHPCRSGPAGQQAMNVFSLVEAFTFKPASDDPFTPRHSSEVQYWAGVIMRNACRKDDARGGIRQCANMRCVKWEQYAREFAKCRRCRRAKYCSKVVSHVGDLVLDWTKWLTKSPPHSANPRRGLKDTATGATRSRAGGVTPGTSCPGRLPLRTLTARRRPLRRLAPRPVRKVSLPRARAKRRLRGDDTTLTTTIITPLRTGTRTSLRAGVTAAPRRRKMTRTTCRSHRLSRCTTRARLLGRTRSDCPAARRNSTSVPPKLARRRPDLYRVWTKTTSLARCSELRAVPVSGSASVTTLTASSAYKPTESEVLLSSAPSSSSSWILICLLDI